jgi:signal transduction histidine kinase
MAQDVLMGVLAVFRRTGEPVFDSADMDRLATVADLAALALWKARLLEEARAADAAKTSLLATLSHELRTPLAALEGYGELLEDEILGPLSKEQREVIVRLRTVGRHLGALIEDILTFASLEADHVTVRRAHVKLEELLDSLHPYIEPLAREKNIHFNVSVDRSLPSLLTDDARVRQILLNLCQNAVKFTENGEVSLHVERGSAADSGEHTVRFQVSDTGIGIAPRDLQRLFRPFSQLEDVPTRRHRGTGLGLYISRRLATLLGGRIEVKSRPGAGSVFTLVLPASDEHG